MNFLDLFSLKDVFIAASGLMVVSIARIYYDSYVEKKKIKNFGASLGIYNSLIEDNKEGLLIVSEHDKIISINKEAAHILHTTTESIDRDYLEKVRVVNTYNSTDESLLEIIHAKDYIANASIDNFNHLPISISINKVNISPQSYNYWYVVIIRDMSSINNLRNDAKVLLES